MTSLLSPATKLSAATTVSALTRSLGLERLVRRLVAEDGFANRETALRGIASYERFFFLAADHLRDPLKDPLAPSLPVDRVWQRHMLDTKAYTEDCFHWAGEYIHRDDGVPQGAFERCVSLLGVAGEAEWGRPGQVHTGAPHTHTQSATLTELAALDELVEPKRTRTEPGKTLDEADFSGLLARVRVALQQKPVALPWITEARQLLESDPALAVEEYRRFLTLLICEAGALTPCKLVDEFWHQHILDSRNYFLFCAGAAGRYLYHIPRYEKTHRFHEPGFTQTQVLYKKHFGSNPPAQVWTHMGESGGCSTEPAPLYTIDLPTCMQAEIAAGNVDKRHYDQLHPVLQRQGLPINAWKEFLHAVDSVPRVSWSDWSQRFKTAGAVLAITSGGVVALCVGLIWEEFTKGDSALIAGTLKGFPLGAMLNWLIAMLNWFLVGVALSLFFSWSNRARDPKEVQRVLSAYAPKLANFGVGIRASEKGASFLVVARGESVGLTGAKELGKGGSRWKCHHCGASTAGYMDLCWRCGAGRDDPLPEG